MPGAPRKPCTSLIVKLYKSCHQCGVVTAEMVLKTIILNSSCFVFVLRQPSCYVWTAGRKYYCCKPLLFPCSYKLQRHSPYTSVTWKSPSWITSAASWIYFAELLAFQHQGEKKLLISVSFHDWPYTGLPGWLFFPHWQSRGKPTGFRLSGQNQLKRAHYLTIAHGFPTGLMIAPSTLSYLGLSWWWRPGPPPLRCHLWSPPPKASAWLL